MTLSVDDLVPAQITGTLHAVYFRRPEWSQADGHPGETRSMHLAAVSWAATYATPCEGYGEMH